MEALNFSHHVLMMEVPAEVRQDRLVSGKIQRLLAGKRVRRQATVLSVEQVAKLEHAVVTAKTPADKYLLGGLVFALYSRSRTSDLVNTSTISEDGAFLECSSLP